MKNQFENRKFTIIILVLFAAIIFLVKIFYIQIIEDKYKIAAESNSYEKVIINPARGQIFDRYGNALVLNQPVYDLKFYPNKAKKVNKELICKLLEIDTLIYNERFQKGIKYSSKLASVFEKQLSKRVADKIQEKIYAFPGFYLQLSKRRQYPKSIAAHVLGYIGEVNHRIIEQNDYYHSGDFIGRSGLEKSYEEVLRGERGFKLVYKDSWGQEKGRINKGKMDKAAVAGTDITLGLSAELQEYGELLMKNKIGSIVAIEPKTGQILACITSPNFDPNLLVGRQMGKNYFVLQKGENKPLINRAISAKYPPGSIFKIVQALIAMELGVIDKNTGFPCNKSLVGCHNHPAASDVQKAIQFSCNPYFYYTYKKIIQQGKYRNIYKDSRSGLAQWVEYALSFGLGKPFDSDIGGILGGQIPDVKFYDDWYGEGKWAFSTIYSNSIGQGEVEVIPIQMANLVAIFANRGWFITPHFIRTYADGKPLDAKFTKKNYTKVNTKHFPIIADAMYDVVNKAGGTARLARVSDISVCGKTGTAQNIKGKDHSVFIAFAPKDDPKIAIAVYVENAGYGGTWAAPIASLMIEKHINDSISNPAKEKRILDAVILPK